MEEFENENIDDLQEMTVEDLVDLKVRLEERIDEINDYLENYEAYNNDIMDE